MIITIETVKPPESGPFHLQLDLTADIRITPERARKKVGVYAGNHIADLLSGEMPQLVSQAEGTFWRVPVVLSSRSQERIGVVGTIDVAVDTGELEVTEPIIEAIRENARRNIGEQGLR
jgi:hypothetical protein